MKRGKEGGRPDPADRSPEFLRTETVSDQSLGGPHQTHDVDLFARLISSGGSRGDRERRRDGQNPAGHHSDEVADVDEAMEPVEPLPVVLHLFDPAGPDFVMCL